MSHPRFHLAIPVHDLDEAAEFYGGILGCPRRSAIPGSTERLWSPSGDPPSRRSGVDVSNPVDGHDVPVPFGVILDPPTFHTLAQALRDASRPFVIEPYVRFEGEPGEQWTMFLLDPSGNALEFKAFAQDDQVFATRRQRHGASGIIDLARHRDTARVDLPPTGRCVATDRCLLRRASRGTGIRLC